MSTEISEIKKKFNIPRLIDYLKQNLPDVRDKIIDDYHHILFDDATFSINLKDLVDDLGYTNFHSLKELINNNQDIFKENVDFKIKKDLNPGKGKSKGDIMITGKTLMNLSILSRKDNAKILCKELNDMFVQFQKYLLENISKNGELSIKNKFDIDVSKFIGCSVIYLLNIEDNLYKFGHTDDVERRLRTHKSNLKFNYIVKIWKLRNKSQSGCVETKIKKHVRHSKLVGKYGDSKEIIKTSDIESVIKAINKYVDTENDQFDGLVKDVHSEQQRQNLDKQLKLKKLDLEIIKHISSLTNDQIELYKNISDHSEDNPSANYDRYFKDDDKMNINIEEVYGLIGFKNSDNAINYIKDNFKGGYIENEEEFLTNNWIIRQVAMDNRTEFGDYVLSKSMNEISSDEENDEKGKSSPDGETDEPGETDETEETDEKDEKDGKSSNEEESEDDGIDMSKFQEKNYKHIISPGEQELIDEQHKTARECGKCNNLKKFEEFDGTKDWCKHCLNVNKINKNRPKNKEFRKKYNKKHREENLDKYKEKDRLDHIKNQEKDNEYSKNYRSIHKDDLNAKRRDKYHKNPEPEKTQKKVYYKGNKKEIREKQKIRYDNEGGEKDRARKRRTYLKKKENAEATLDPTKEAHCSGCGSDKKIEEFIEDGKRSKQCVKCKTANTERARQRRARKKAEKENMDRDE